MTARTFPATTFRRIIHAVTLSVFTAAYLLLALLRQDVPTPFVWAGVVIIAGHLLNIVDNLVAYGIAKGHNATAVER